MRTLKATVDFMKPITDLATAHTIDIASELYYSTLTKLLLVYRHIIDINSSYMLQMHIFLGISLDWFKLQCSRHKKMIELNITSN